MSLRPPTMDEVTLVPEADAIHTFSNGTEWECWAGGNCLACKWYDWDELGATCAFEGAAMLHRVSPALALQFGWTQTTTEYGPLDGWEPPTQCRYYKDEDDESPDPPIIDPTQFTFLAPEGFPDLAPAPHPQRVEVTV